MLRDPDQQEWYSNIPAADLWRWLINKNPFYLTSEPAWPGLGPTWSKSLPRAAVACLAALLAACFPV